MRQLVLTGTRQLAIETSKPRPLLPTEVRMTVHACGICGSDVNGYAGINTRRSAGMVMGHEVAGEVVQAGGRVSQITTGDRVVVNPIVSCGGCPQCLAGLENLCGQRVLYGCALERPGGFATEIIVRATNLVPFSGDVPLEWGALVEPLSVGHHAVRLADVNTYSDVLVVGGGPIGMAIALAARQRGAARITVSEPSKHRRQVAAALGFDTLNPGTTSLPTASSTHAFDCVGRTGTANAAIASLRPRGALVVVGSALEAIAINVGELEGSERRILGSYGYSADEFRTVASLVVSRAVNVAALIEGRVSLDGAPDVFAGYADGSVEAMKTIVLAAE